MHRAKASHYLDENLPNLTLLNVGLNLFMVAYLLENVTVVGQLHHNAKLFIFIIYESLLVLNDIRMPDRGKYADLINGILTLLLAQVVQLDLLHRILNAILQSLDLVHLRVSPVANLLEHLKISNSRRDHSLLLAADLGIPRAALPLSHHTVLFH